MTVDNPEELQARLNARRTALNLTTKKVASLAGIDQNTCARVLRGSNCRWESLLAVANAIRNEELRIREELEAGGGSTVAQPAQTQSGGASPC